MPRINIEDSLTVDERFKYFARAIGNTYTAIGICYSLWRLAQNYWVKGESPIPKDVMDLTDFPVDLLIKSKLLIEEPTGFYAAGSKEQFKWLMNCHINGGKGGRPKKNNDITKPIGIPLAPHGEPSSSSSSSSSLTTTREINKFEETFEPVNPEISEAVSSIYKQFKQTVPKDVRRNLARIKNHFENRESFANWSNEIFELNKGARQYTVALLKEIGAFN